MLFPAKIHERENQVCDDRSEKQSWGVKEGALDGGVGWWQEAADELLIYADTLCIVRLV